MGINKVWIEDGCISCGVCVQECPDVFEMDEMAIVKDGVNFNNNEDCIKSAAENCPVDVIKFE